MREAGSSSCLRGDQCRQYDHHATSVGSYIALCHRAAESAAVGYAIATMLIVILIYDQLLSRPLVAWADRFASNKNRCAAAGFLGAQRFAPLSYSRPAHPAVRFVVAAVCSSRAGQKAPRRRNEKYGRSTAGLPSNGPRLSPFSPQSRSAGCTLRRSRHHDVRCRHGIALGLATLSRIVVLIALATVIWVPIAFGSGTRPHVANLVQPIAQFLAAFPANLLFPIAVSAIVAFKLNPNIWLSPLMILARNGTSSLMSLPARRRSPPSCARPAPISRFEAGCGGGGSRFPRCCHST